MKLREIIKEIPDDDWLEITEQSSTNYRNYIGRAPKKYIVGKVLYCEAFQIYNNRSNDDHQIHRFLVTDNFIVCTDR
ncbi:hypothetical protein EFN92_03810 [Lactococcus lactis]|uniref:hypothetical protein n=1 Tax=Lactococcus lactis TaxID=1358 RepID=UPI0021A6BC71|nr:hypothetical protein [Lactococcus lactis]MCT3091804.1 hypothetical protein [Lactococcus lactis]